MNALKWLRGALDPQTMLNLGAGLLMVFIVALFVVAAGCAHAPPPKAEPPPSAARVEPPPAAEPAKAAAAAEPPKVDDVEAVLSGAALHFEFDRAELTDESTHRLQRVAEALRTHPGVKVKISGHCDERGTQEYNFALGQQRAEAARRYLLALGIPQERIETVSFGAEQPAVQGHDDQAWAKNRRDELSRGH